MSEAQDRHAVGNDDSEDPQISLVALLNKGVAEVDGKRCGRIEDVIVHLVHNGYAEVTGIAVKDDNDDVTLVLSESLVDFQSNRVELKSDKWGVRPVALHDGEISLKSEILCQRVVDVPRSALVKVYDVRLAKRGTSWEAVALDVHRHRWFAWGSHASHAARDWRSFLPLGRDAAFPIAPSAPNWIGRLKPAQIADLIEEADAEEQEQLLAQVHSDPELEADVFEELEEDGQAKVFKSLDDQEVAQVLSRMRADDVADAVMELAQVRRQRVLDLVPEPQRKKIMTLLGYNRATAGGLMGTEFVALSEDRSVHDAIQHIRQATTNQPEALTTIHITEPNGKLVGTLGIVLALQTEPSTLLRDAADRTLVSAAPEDDLPAVVNRMADFNLLSLPVVDPNGTMIGVITVDDALEAAIPHDWTNR